MVRFPNGFYSFSDSHFKAMKKQDLINYIRTIEKNWENQLITNDIQYSNCKRLLAEERNKAIDEFAEKLKYELNGNIIPDKEKFTYTIKLQEQICHQNTTLKRAIKYVEYIADQMKGGE